MADRKTTRIPEAPDSPGADVAAPLPPPRWTAPEAPTLSPDEADAAIRAGGFTGLLRAIRDKIPDRPVADAGEAAGAASHLIDQYRAGGGGADQAEILDQIGPYLLAADILRQALRSLAGWIQANPGALVPDGSHGSGRRRVF